MAISEVLNTGSLKPFSPPSTFGINSTFYIMYFVCNLKPLYFQSGAIHIWIHLQIAELRNEVIIFKWLRRTVFAYKWCFGKILSAAQSPLQWMYFSAFKNTKKIRTEDRYNYKMLLHYFLSNSDLLCKQSCRLYQSFCKCIFQGCIWICLLNLSIHKNTVLLYWKGLLYKKWSSTIIRKADGWLDIATLIQKNYYSHQLLLTYKEIIWRTRIQLSICWLMMYDMYLILILSNDLVSMQYILQA